MAAAVTAALTGAPASAGLFKIDYYSDYVENPWIGMDASGSPFFSESIDDVTYVDFNLPGRPNASTPFAAIITGTFTVTGTEQEFTIGSDDGAYLLLDGMLAGANPGVHGYSTAT